MVGWEVVTYTKTSIAGRTIYASGSVRHYRLHGTVGMFDRLRPIGMGDELGRRRAVGMVNSLSRCGAGLCGLGGNLPLRHARGELHVVVFFAGAVPLRDPAGRKLRRGKRGTLVARRSWASHGPFFDDGRPVFVGDARDDDEGEGQGGWRGIQVIWRRKGGGRWEVGGFGIPSRGE